MTRTADMTSPTAPLDDRGLEAALDTKPFDDGDETVLSILRNGLAGSGFIMRTPAAKEVATAFIRAYMAALDPVPTHRHKKRGTDYVLIGIGKMQAETWADTAQWHPVGAVTVDMREVTIYRGVDDGKLWVRPREEFEDGRFEALAASLPSTGAPVQEAFVRLCEELGIAATAVAYLEARRIMAAPSTGAGMVRGLEWEEVAFIVSMGWMSVALASTPFGHYAVDEREGTYRVTLCGQTIANCRPADKMTAKAAAQADYERRIRSALVTEERIAP